MADLYLSEFKGTVEIWADSPENAKAQSEAIFDKHGDDFQISSMSIPALYEDDDFT